jgi:hypothetical protein
MRRGRVGGASQLTAGRVIVYKNRSGQERGGPRIIPPLRNRPELQWRCDRGREESTHIVQCTQQCHVGFRTSAEVYRSYHIHVVSYLIQIL